MRRKKRNKRTGKFTYSIIVDGETEIWYFQMMKKHENLHRIDIRPEIPRKKKLKEQFELVCEYAENYDMVIWLIDFDTLLKEHNERKRGTISIIKKFEKYRSALERKYLNRVKVLVNSPCLEYWYLLHFIKTDTFYQKCNEPIKKLKNQYMTDYKKSEKFYKKRDNDIYERLKPKQSEAMQNAKDLGAFDFGKINSAKAEIYKILEILGI